MLSKRFAASGTNWLRLTRLLKSESVRVAAATAALFVVTTAVLIGVVLWIVADTQSTSLTQANDDDIATVLAGFRAEGLGEAKEVLRQRIGDSQDGASAGSQTYMRIQGRDDAGSLGNLPRLPETIGAFDLALFPRNGKVVLGAVTEQGTHILIAGRGLRLDDAYYLFVGRGTSSLTETRHRILQAFFWVMLGAIGVAALGGIVLARRLIRRVDNITQTCEGIVAGRLGERIAASGAGSEWDRLARAINEMLNRIAGLLENLQQVSSDVAHDLRTPLTRMRHRLETARNAPLGGPDYLRAIDRAIGDTDQILALFAALLRIAQIEAGTRAASFKPVDLAELASNICLLYRPAAEDGHRQLEQDAGPAAIMGDPELLFQMVSNLVENAIRHTPEGSHIVVRVAAEHGRASIEIADNGGGIPDAEIGKVTRRFYRLEGSRSSPGHGLGLALVAAIAQLHGARLVLQNASPGLIARIEFALKAFVPAARSTVEIGAAGKHASQVS